MTPKRIVPDLRAVQRCPWSTGWVAVLLLSACTYWVPYPALTPTAQEALPSSLRVSRGSGTVLLVEPYVRSDTLFGRVGKDTLGIPLAESLTVERQRVDALRTTGLTLGVLALMTVAGLYTVQ